MHYFIPLCEVNMIIVSSLWGHCNNRIYIFLSPERVPYSQWIVQELCRGLTGPVPFQWRGHGCSPWGIRQAWFVKNQNGHPIRPEKGELLTGLLSDIISNVRWFALNSKRQSFVRYKRTRRKCRECFRRGGGFYIYLHYNIFAYTFICDFSPSDDKRSSLSDFLLQSFIYIYIVSNLRHILIINVIASRHKGPAFLFRITN